MGEFVSLHHSLSTLSQSHKFRCRCQTLSQSQSLGIFKGWSQCPNFLNPGVRVPQKMRTPHPCRQQLITTDTSTSSTNNMQWNTITTSRQKRITTYTLNGLSKHTSTNSLGFSQQLTALWKFPRGKNNRNSTKHNSNTDFRTRKDF